MILTLRQLVLTLEPDAGGLLQRKLGIISSGHLLVTIICIYLFLPWRALCVQRVYLGRLYYSLVFRIYICELRLHILFVTSMAIVAIRVLQ